MWYLGGRGLKPWASEEGGGQEEGMVKGPLVC